MFTESTQLDSKIALCISVYLNRVQRYEEARETLLTINLETLEKTDQALVTHLLDTMPLRQLSCDDFTIEKLFPSLAS